MTEHASHDPRYHYLDDTPLHKLWTEAVGKPGYDKGVWSAVFGLIWARCPCGMEKRLARRENVEEMNEK